MPTPNFAALLQKAITEPGLISAAYSQFHTYSMGNILLAACECGAREIPLGPIATFPRWKALGRHVKKGEKALTLCMPVTMRKRDEGPAAADGTTTDKVFQLFIYRPRWFVLSQTEGKELDPVALPEWDQARALKALDVAYVPFELPDGNVMGYAKGREIAINPLNPEPTRTVFHELAHILHGHTAETMTDGGDRTPKDIREVEAEGVALLCCAALGLPGEAYSRGYMQSWYGTGQPIPEKSAQRIFKVTDQILRAGRPAAATEDE